MSHFSLSSFFLFFWFLLSCSNSAPNILFILIDDGGYNDVEYDSNITTNVYTPNLNKLVNNGIKLNNYYTQSMCTPSRAALMTGRYPMRYGLQNLVIEPDYPWGVPLDEVFLPEELQRGGYKTYMVGKWHLGHYKWEYTPTYRGFDDFYGILLGKGDYYNHTSKYHFISGYDFRNNTEAILPIGDYSTELYGNKTLDILEKHDYTNPFFIYLSFQSPHIPNEVPDEYLEYFDDKIVCQTSNYKSCYQRKIRAAQIYCMDTYVGKIVDYLKDNDIWDDTLLIFSSDNGGDVPNGGSNFPYRGNKATLWEGGIKSLALISGGYINESKQGTESDSLFHISDWLPTFLDLTNMNSSSNYSLDGISQLSVITSDSDIGTYDIRKEMLININPLACVTFICGSIRYKSFKYSIGNAVSLPLKKWTSWNYVYGIDEDTQDDVFKSTCRTRTVPEFRVDVARPPYTGEGVLYNLRLDPCETTNLIRNTTFQLIRTKLLKKLLKYSVQQRLPIVKIPQPVKSNPENFGGFWTPWITDEENKKPKAKKGKFNNYGAMFILISSIVIMIAGVMKYKNSNNNYIPVGKERDYDTSIFSQML